MPSLPPLNKVAHAKFCKRCLNGLPSSALEADSARVVVGFYCLGAMDLLGILDEQTKETERDGWREWIWSQQLCSNDNAVGGFRPGPYMHVEGYRVTPEMGGLSRSPPHLVVTDFSNDNAVGGFRPGPYMHVEGYRVTPEMGGLSINPPHLVVTYTALLSLAILRDDFAQLNRTGIICLLRATQLDDGSFTAIPGQGEADMRMVYTAFAISAMLDDWSGFDVEKAIKFIKSCITYEGGFGQAPYNEAQGGPTYCALASLHLVPERYKDRAQLCSSQRRRLIRWLIMNQFKDGGFAGRTEKPADACYSFWCGASLQILGVASLVDNSSNALFLYDCQFKYGGIAKAPDEHPDPYHTYLSLAALAMYPPIAADGDSSENASPRTLAILDPLLNATQDTVKWIREHVPARNATAL